MKEPLARAIATRYVTPGEYAVTAAPEATCVSAIEKPPPAPTTLPCSGDSMHESMPELYARARGASSSAASTISLEAIC